MSLIARYLEARDIATVVFGCAYDIVTRCRVPRFVFSDFPLGNAGGKPFSLMSQRALLELGIATLNSTAPGQVIINPERWDETDDWKRDYCNVDQLTADEFEKLRREFEQQKVRARVKR